ncbi:hypothetical protein BH10BAC5_BH10BAC5_24060 [soil metagenome]
MRSTRFIFTAILIFMSSSIFSQSRQWENFTTMKSIKAIAVVPGSSLLFAATTGGMFAYNTQSNTYQKYTNLNGLLSIDINCLKVDSRNRLWIGASDGSISILDLTANTFSYIYDIKLSNENNRSVNSFVQYNDFMFVGTGYGIQKISINNFSFVDAPYYKLGNLQDRSSVNALLINHDSIFVATNFGAALAPIINTNLNNPTLWRSYSGGFIPTGVKTIEAYNNFIFFGSSLGMTYYNGVNFEDVVSPSSGPGITSIKAFGNRLYFARNGSTYYLEGQDFITGHNDLTDASINIISISSDNKLVYGTISQGLYMSLNGNPYAIYAPDGPNSNSFLNVAVDNQNGNVWGAGGGGDGFYKYDGISWTNYNLGTYPQIGNTNDFRTIVIGRNSVWALSFGGGATILRDTIIYNFNPANAKLPGIDGNPNYCTLTGGAFDNLGNLWASVYVTNTSKSLYVFDGTQWRGMFNPSIFGGANLTNLAIDNYNTKWAISVTNPPRGIYFFNENGTLDNPSDDIYGFYTTGEFPGGNITDLKDIIVEKNNEVWVTTNNGVFIISNPLAAIQNPNNKPPLQKLGIISGNLKVPFTENCRAIKNDILNEKWVGTEGNGVFHFSSDGATLIEQFNTKNSPILDDKINSIAISSKTGKAYFATQKGLSALKTNAIEPVSSFDKIICSPNPYLIPASVSMNIDGLVENSVIKIISLNGEVMNEFDTPGGKIAKWNGADKNGKNVPSGIYMVVAYNKDGSKVGVGKVVVIRNQN